MPPSVPLSDLGCARLADIDPIAFDKVSPDLPVLFSFSRCLAARSRPSEETHTLCAQCVPTGYFDSLTLCNYVHRVLLSGSFQRREPPLTDQLPHISKKPRVAIIGAGVVGLGIAWRLAGRAVVTVFDRGKAGAGASHAAAGMLAACCEAEPGEEALVALGRESQARWPAFAEELLRASGIDVELRREGTLVLALDRGRSGRDRPSSGVSAATRSAARMAVGRRHAQPRAASGR